ncbi:unnamed protein product, partial [Nesidiocoris tenuis]
MFSHPRPPQNRSGTTTSTNYVRSVNWFMQFGRYHDRQIRSSIRQSGLNAVTNLKNTWIAYPKLKVGFSVNRPARRMPGDFNITEAATRCNPAACEVVNIGAEAGTFSLCETLLNRSSMNRCIVNECSINIPSSEFPSISRLSALRLSVSKLWYYHVKGQYLHQEIGIIATVLSQSESLTEQVSVCPSTVKTGQNLTEKILCAIAVRIFETQIEGIGVACSAKVYELVHKFRRSSHRQYKTNNEHHNHDNHLLSTTVIASLQHHRFDCNCEPKMLLIIGSPESSRFNLHILESHKQKGMKSAKKHGQTHQPQPEQGLSPHRTNQHSDNYLVVKFHTPKIGSNLFSERLHHPRVNLIGSWCGQPGVNLPKDEIPHRRPAQPGAPKATVHVYCIKIYRRCSTAIQTILDLDLIFTLKLTDRNGS